MERVMTIERIMRFLFSNELFYATSRRYEYSITEENKQLAWWYHDGFELLSNIRKQPPTG